MRNSVFYLLGLLVFVFFVFVTFKASNSVKVEAGLTYETISKEEAIVGTYFYDIFVLQNDGETNYEVYKVIDYPSESGARLVYFKTKTKEERPLSDLFEAAYHHQLSFKDTLNIGLEEGKAIVANVSFFEGRRYIPPGGNPDDLFTKIEDSALVFLFFSLGVLALLLFLNFLFRIFKAPKNSTRRYSIQIVVLALFVLFLFRMATPHGFSNSKIIPLILLVVIFGLIYFVYQFDDRKSKKGYDNFLKEEAYKFLLLFGTSIIVIISVNYFCAFLDKQIFKSDGFTVLAVHGRMHLELGFAFSFALGNLLHNLIKYFWSLRNQNKNLKKNEGDVLKSEAALNAIQASVNPHFLYNSLNSIASLAKVDPEKTEAMTLALSEFYKYTTNRGEDPLSSVSDEVEMLETYLGIEKIRFGERLQFDLKVSPGALMDKIPHFLLQPLMENAIKYGYNERTETIDIELIIEKKNKNLQIQIFDSGKPFDEQLSSGYGLKSVLKKLTLLFPNQHHISFVNEPNKHVLITIQN